MAKETISVRVTQATFEEFEEYRHDEGTETEPLSKADAGRKLIESGLENEKRPDTVPPRSGTDRDGDDSEPQGLFPTLMSLAGDDLRTQIQSFGVWMVFAAVFLFAFGYVPVLGPVFLIPAGVFGILSTTTLFGIGAGFVDQLDPEPADSSETPSDAEVKQ